MTLPGQRFQVNFWKLINGSISCSQLQQGSSTNRHRKLAAFSNEEMAQNNEKLKVTTMAQTEE
jgi:hypothetical protein